MPRFLIELPADEPERARRFWQEMLETTLESRRPEQGRGWQTEYEGIVFGLHERGPGPRRPLLAPLLPGRRPHCRRRAGARARRRDRPPGQVPTPRAETEEPMPALRRGRSFS